VEYRGVDDLSRSQQSDELPLPAWGSFSNSDIEISGLESDSDDDISLEESAYRPHRGTTVIDTGPKMPDSLRIDTTNVDWELVEPTAEHQHHSPLKHGFGFDTDPNPAVVDYDGMGATVVKFTDNSSSGQSRPLGFGPDYERLARLNEGRHSATGDLSTRTSELDKIRITQAFCSRLDLPRHQMTDAAKVILFLDLDEFGNQKRLERVALGVINVVVNWHRFQLRNNLNAKRINQTSQFKALMEAHDVDSSDLWSIKGMVKEHISEMDYFDSGRIDNTDHLE